MKSFEYINAESVETAVEALESGNRLLKAGGIDLLDEMKAGVVAPDGLVNLLTVKAHRDVAESGDRIVYGALMTLAELAKAAPGALGQAALDAATPEVRNMATLGGNLCQHSRCWYYRLPEFPCLRRGGSECPAIEGQNKYHALFDNGVCADVAPSNLAPALVALDAVVLTNAREIPAAEFFVAGPERMNSLREREIVVGVALPKKPAPSAYVEVRERQSFDWALASAAVALGDVPRVVLGHVASVPRRAAKVEEAIAGKKMSAELAAAASAEADDGATPLAHNAYKRKLVRAVVRRALLAAAGIKDE